MAAITGILAFSKHEMVCCKSKVPLNADSFLIPKCAFGVLGLGAKLAKSIPAQKCFPCAERTITLALASFDIESTKLGSSDQKALFIELNSSGLHISMWAILSFISHLKQL